MFLLLRRMAAILCAVMTLAFSLPARADSGALNLLLIGVDSSSGSQRGRSDTMMLARIDPEAGTVRLASFLRDLYVSIPGVGKTRLNAAYHYGGEDLLKETLKQNFGVEIDRTATVHFSLLADLVDQVGGVEVDVSPKERIQLNSMIADYNADYGLSVPGIDADGLQRLNGTQALCYSRIRKIDSDFQRTSRQQAVIHGLLKQLSNLSRWELISLGLNNLKRIETDLSFGDLLSLLPLLNKSDTMEIQSAHVPFEGTYRDETVNGMMVLNPNLKLCKQKLTDFLAGS